MVKIRENLSIIKHNQISTFSKEKIMEKDNLMIATRAKIQKRVV